MRAGPVLFLAAIALLCAGVVSTRGVGQWKSPETIEVPIDMAGVDTIDLRDTDVASVVISAERPHVAYRNAGRNTSDMKNLRPHMARVGNTLKISYSQEYSGSETLFVTPQIGRILASNATIQAKARVQRIRIDATGTVNWSGDAGTLEFVDTGPKPGCIRGYGCTASFQFADGTVGSLAITTRSGQIQLQDLSGVGTVALRTGPDAKLHLEHVGDLPRIRFNAIEAAGDAAARGAAQ